MAVYKKFKISIILMLLLYVIQFLLFTRLFPNYFRVSTEASILYWGSMLITVVIGFSMGNTTAISWILGDILYLICIAIYSSNGAYNIDLDHQIRLKWYLLTLLIYAVEIVVFQIIVVYFLKKTKSIIGKLKKRN